MPPRRVEPVSSLLGRRVHHFGPLFEQPGNALDVGATLLGYLRPGGKFDGHKPNLGSFGNFGIGIRLVGIAERVKLSDISSGLFRVAGGIAPGTASHKLRADRVKRTT